MSKKDEAKYFQMCKILLTEIKMLRDWLSELLHENEEFRKKLEDK